MLLGQKTLLLVALMTSLVLMVAACSPLGEANAQEAGDGDGGGFFGFGGGNEEEAGAEEGAEGDAGEAEDGAEEGDAGEEEAVEAEDGAEEGDAGEEEAVEEGAEEEAGEEEVDGNRGDQRRGFRFGRGGRGGFGNGDDPPRQNPDPEVEEPEDPAPGDDPCDPQGLPIHDGTQTSEVGGAVCNPGAMGVLPGPDNTPVVVITEPANGSVLPAGEDIFAAIAFQGFEAGLFDDPQAQYGLRPFSLGPSGNIIGHSHLYVQNIDGLNSGLDSFLALNDPSDDNTLSGDIPAVDEPGEYRICADLSGGNHLAAPKGVAQQSGGADCVQITIE